MTWMIVRLILSLAFVGGVLWFAARLAKKRGLGQGNGLIEVVARQRMGRASTINVVRIADVVLVVGATEEHVTVLTEMDPEAVDAALAERRPTRLHAAADAPEGGQPAAAGLPTPRPAAATRSTSSGALTGSVFDRAGWGALVNGLRERTVRRP
jgi:flagellar protein FliO/FliZ